MKKIDSWLDIQRYVLGATDPSLSELYAPEKASGSEVETLETRSQVDVTRVDSLV